MRGCEDCDDVKADGSTGVNFGGPPKLRLPSAQDMSKESVRVGERGKERKRGTRSWGWAEDILLPTAPDLETSRGLPLYFAFAPPVLELTFSPLFSLHLVLELTFSPLFSLGRQSHGFQVCIFCAGCVVLDRRIEKKSACESVRVLWQHVGMHRSMQHKKACNICNNQRSPQSVGCVRPLEELFCEHSLAPSAPGLRFASDTRASSVVRILLEFSKGYLLASFLKTRRR